MVTISIPKSGECEIDASLKRITNFTKKNQVVIIILKNLVVKHQ